MKISDIKTKDQITEILSDTKKLNDFLKTNKPFILKISKKFYYKNCGYEFEDLVQEGYICLIKALNNFNDKYDGLGTFVSFAYIVVHGTVGRMARAANRKQSQLIMYDKDVDDKFFDNFEDRMVEECMVEGFYKELTDVEIQVYQLWSKKISIKEIARELSMTVNSIKHLVYNKVKIKLEAYNRVCQEV